MNRFLAVAVIGTCVFATSAFAADIARPVYKATPAPLPFSWTGFYLGGHAGYGWSDANASTTSSVAPLLFDTATFNLDGKGVVGGLQLGYNWQIAPNWVIGAEADISGTGIGKTASAPVTLGGNPVPPGLQHNISRDIDWLATLRGRLGYSWDRTLAYVTGGFAWGKVNYGAQSSFATIGWDAADFSSTQTGWTLGGGLEWAFASNWSAKVEYLYYDLEGASATTFGVTPILTALHKWDDTTISVVRAGVNYRFGADGRAAYADATSPAYKTASAAPFNWTGLYVGGHVGYGWNDATGTTSSAGPVSLFDTATFSLDGNGVVAGAQIGYNWQVAPHWVIGVEADMSGTGIGERAYGPLTGFLAPLAGFQHQIGQDVEWLATLRGRLGYSWDRTLAYVTGGLAWGKVNYEAQSSRNPVGFQAADFSSTQSGWTLGGGLEWAVTDNWTAKLEYLHYDLEGASISVPGGFGFAANHRWDDTTISVVRAGVNYKFGDYGKYPVVAKY